MTESTRTVKFGECEYTYPSDELRPLRSSADLVGDRDALLARLEEDGYLYLPGFLDRDEVLEARQTILNFMAEHEAMEPGSRPLDGVMGQYGKNVNMMGRVPITHEPTVDRVLAADRLYELYELLHGEPALTFDYKWLRAVGNEACTGCHMDHVYMGRGSDRLMTAWIPIADIPIEQGTLTIVPGSNRMPEYEKLRNTYGRMDVDAGDISEGWFTRDPREVTEKIGGYWQTSDVRAGDVITFGMHLLHASTTNTTDRWRLSCDVRFQPKADPVDPRWIGKNPPGHTRRVKATKTMAQAKEEWGL
jgi:hypothetical protein